MTADVIATIMWCKFGMKALIILHTAVNTVRVGTKIYRKTMDVYNWLNPTTSDEFVWIDTVTKES